jgi:hypothetical protein
MREFAIRQPDVCGLRLYVKGKNQRGKQVYQKLKREDSGYIVYEKEFTKPQ